MNGRVRCSRRWSPRDARRRHKHMFAVNSPEQDARDRPTHVLHGKLKPLLPDSSPSHRTNSTTLSSESPAVGDAIRGWRPEGARGGAGGSSAFPTQTDIAFRSVVKNSQWPRSPAVGTPNLRSAFLMVRENDALVWAAARKATSTVIPRSVRKHECSAQFLFAHNCKIGASLVAQWKARSKSFGSCG